MISSKALYSKYFSEYKMNDHETERLHKVLLDMFIDLKTVFEKNDIQYMMSGGSLLGTIRHKGFIPWDDDIDIMMLRCEYEKFKNIFSKTLGNKYILAEPLRTSKYYSKAPKVYKKGTEYVEIPTAGIDSLQMVFIDIFIIENIPESMVVRKAKSILYDICFKAASVCLDYMYPSPVILEKAKTEQEVRKYYAFRRRLGCIFSKLGGIKLYLRLCENLSRGKAGSELLGIPSGISYSREIFEKKIFMEIDTGEFCGEIVSIPRYYDVYLKNLYGDYMVIPPIEKRENHVAVRMKF